MKTADCVVTQKMCSEKSRTKACFVACVCDHLHKAMPFPAC